MPHKHSPYHDRIRIYLFALGVALALNHSVALPVQEVIHTHGNALDIDAVYVIGMEQCETRWAKMREWASEKQILITPVFGTSYKEINLMNPPIPIVGITNTNSIRAGQVGCTMSHLRTWRDAFARNYSRIIVMEDDVRLTDSLLARLPQVFHHADEGSRTQNGLPWHYIYLRIFPTKFKKRVVWHDKLLHALPGWGTAAYALSGAGIRYLLTRVTTYTYPLDVQIEMLQKGIGTQGVPFIALDGCTVSSAGKTSPGCRRDVSELSRSEKGNCGFSSSQAGAVLHGKDFPGTKVSQKNSKTIRATTSHEMKHSENEKVGLEEQENINREDDFYTYDTDEDDDRESFDFDDSDDSIDSDDNGNSSDSGAIDDR